MKRLFALLFSALAAALVLVACTDHEVPAPAAALPKVLWLGTSIPSMSAYPLVASQRLGLRCINRAVGSSFVVFDSAQVERPKLHEGFCLTASSEEKRRKFAKALASGALSAADFEVMQFTSYDRLLLPALDSVDYVVIDHGFNDRASIARTLRAIDQGEPFDWESRDRSHFVGALNFLIDLIAQHNPKAKIIIGGYFQNTLNTSSMPSAAVCELQARYAQRKGLPLLDVWRHLDFGASYVPNSQHYLDEFNAQYDTDYVNLFPDAAGNVTRFQYYCPDGVHPHTDLTGRSDQLLNEVYTQLLGKAIGRGVQQK